MTRKSVTVVGGGFGGLSAACCLQRERGFDVTLIEKNENLGGVANVIEEDGYRFDTGPSWYLMPEVFERFFDRFGRMPRDYYNLIELDPQFSVHWKDGDSVQIPEDDEAVAQIFSQYEDGADDAYKRYMQESEETYELGMKRFVYANRDRLRDFVDADVIKSARAMKLFTNSLGDHVSNYFQNEKVKQMLLFNIVFLGGTPRNTPAFYKLMTHATMNGVYYPEGGMYELVKGMQSLAENLGVNIETDTPATKIQESNDGYIVQSNDESFQSDIVVSNADYQYTEQNLLEESLRNNDSSYWYSIEYAPSALMLYLGVEGTLDMFEHHSLIFPENWDEHFQTIEDSSGLPENPAYYVNVPSRTDDTVSPDDSESMVVLVPIGSGMNLSEDEIDKFRDKVIEDIGDTANIDLDNRIELERRACIEDFNQMYNKSEGTALGISHTLRQTSILRPSMRYREGLYFAGGDTRPGIGVPMATISGMHVTELIKQYTN